MANINSRIRELRKALGLSQINFGKPVGLSRDEVKNIEYDKTVPRDITIPIICREFRVSYDWLTTGQGEMFEDLPDSLLDEIAQQYNLDQMDKQIIKSFLELSDDDRAVVKRYINKVLDK